MISGPFLFQIYSGFQLNRINHSYWILKLKNERKTFDFPENPEKLKVDESVIEFTFRWNYLKTFFSDLGVSFLHYRSMSGVR